MAVTRPAPKVHLGFGSTWTTTPASITWTEVTRYVRKSDGISVQRGRLSELDDFAPGTANFTLKNDDRRFDPQHAGGPYFGQLVPGVPVRITADYAGVTYPVFQGFIKGWPQRSLRGNRQSSVPISATDGTRFLAQADLPSSVYAVEVAADDPHVWYRLAETAGASMADSSDSKVDGTYESGTTLLSGRHPNQWETVPALHLDGEHWGTVVDRAAYITDVPFVVEAIIKIPPLPENIGASIGSQPVFAWQGRGDTGAQVSLGLGPSSHASDGRPFGVSLMPSVSHTAIWSTGARCDDNEPHHIAIRRTASVHEVYVDGVAQTTDTSAGAGVVTNGITIAGSAELANTRVIGDVADVAIHDADIGAARIAAHAAGLHTPWDGDTTGARIGKILDLVGWPATARSLDTGYSLLGPAVLGRKALEALKGIEEAEQGRLFIDRSGNVRFLNRYYTLLDAAGATPQATFTGQHFGDFDIDYDDELVYTSASASRPGGTTITVSDAAAVGAYGDKAAPNLGRVELRSDAEVRSLVEYRLDRYKAPQHRIGNVAIPLHEHPGSIVNVLNREIGHRLRFVRNPQGIGSPIQLDEILEGIEHEFTNHEWKATLRLSPVDTRKYAVWGTSLWDDAEARWGF